MLPAFFRCLCVLSLIDTSLLVIIPHLNLSFGLFICAYQTGSFYERQTKTLILLFYIVIVAWLKWKNFNLISNSVEMNKCRSEYIDRCGVFCQLKMTQLDLCINEQSIDIEYFLFRSSNRIQMCLDHTRNENKMSWWTWNFLVHEWNLIITSFRFILKLLWINTQFMYGNHAYCTRCDTQDISCFRNCEVE